ELAAAHRLEVEPAARAHHLDRLRLELLHAAALAEDALGRDRVDALAALLVRRGHAADVGPLRPRIGRRAGVGRARQQLELMAGERALAVHRAAAVGARVAAADGAHALALAGRE